MVNTYFVVAWHDEGRNRRCQQDILDQNVPIFCAGSVSFHDVPKVNKEFAAIHLSFDLNWNDWDVTVQIGDIRNGTEDSESF